MPFALRIAGAALADLKSVRRWLTQPGAGLSAAARSRRIRVAIDDLKSDPLRWPLGEHAGTRARTVEGHRIVYTVTLGQRSGTGRVEVLRVFGPGQSRDDL